MTMLPRDGSVSDELITYHEARTRGGAGANFTEGCRAVAATLLYSKIGYANEMPSLRNREFASYA